VKIGADKPKPPCPRVRLECWHGEKKLETQYLGLKNAKDIAFHGPGVTGKVLYDLRKHGKAESEMESGRTFKYEVEK
jgi:hypothetical protein